MNIKRTVFKIAVMIFMVFAVSSVTEYSYAYWASGVTGNSATESAVDVTVGTFTFYEAWDANTTYNTGDIVKHNGVIYQAKKNGVTKEPGVDGGWNSQWNVIG